MAQPDQDASAHYAEADLLSLSALQHLLFCERQCALIHLEGAWAENRLTAEGRILHERVHDITDESRGDLRVVRGLRLHSLALGLYGVADVVEFHRVQAGGVALPEIDGRWRPMPVEYKRGRPKSNDIDRVQLCAQAICLEGMLQVDIPDGSIFYGQPRRREEVVFDNDLRQLVGVTADRLHRLMGDGITPSARYDKRCRSCSLEEICLPKSLHSQDSVSRYLDKALS
jgi:CRISPR-associated exonuclease Cas4